MSMFQIRPATRADARFLGDMLVEAANWNLATARPRIAGWPRPGDFGSVADDAHGVAIGACWGRLFPANAPGYGFVATRVPELTLGVNAQWRARGVGRALVQAVARQAAAAGFSRVSLSVERANFAQRLYVSEGFVTVESGVDSDTMVLTVR